MNQQIYTHFGTREATPDDAALLVSLYNASFHDDFVKYGECPAYGRSVADMEKSINRYPKLLLLWDSEEVGALSYIDNGGGRYYIGCLCVIPLFQGSGIGSAALAHFKTLMPDWREISLITPADNVRNLGFYTKKCGFTAGETVMDGNVRVVKLTLSRAETVRKAKQDDIDGVFALYRSLVGTPGCVWNDAYPTRGDAATDVRNGNLYLLCDGAEILAVATAGYRLEENGLTCWSPEIKRPCDLARVGVRRDRQKQGLAGRLIKHIEAEAAAAGYDGIRLLAFKENPNAVALYHSLHYRTIGEAALFDTGVYLCMEKAFKKEGDSL